MKPKKILKPAGFILLRKYLEIMINYTLNFSGTSRNIVGKFANTFIKNHFSDKFKKSTIYCSIIKPDS